MAVRPYVVVVVSVVEMYISEYESDEESVDVIELSEGPAEVSVLEASTLVELELEP